MKITPVALAVKYLVYDIATDSMKKAGPNYKAAVDRLSEKAGEDEDGSTNEIPAGVLREGD